MNRFFTLLLAASCLTAVGQVDSQSLVFDGFTLIYLGDSTAFFISDHELPWDQAQASCSDLGGHLATFATYEENTAVVEASVGGFWFGLSQSPGASEPDLGWGWITGEQLSYSAWFTSEPNNATGAEDCAIQIWQDYTAWDDATCSYSYPYVLEVTAVEGCTDSAACNYNVDAILDDGSCDLFTCRCLEGTIWSEELGGCIVANPSDSNFDGCVQLNDLLDLLSAYGDCGAEEAPWLCGDPLEYQGYDYATVLIGDHCWFAENCRYLPAVSPPTQGSEQNSGAHAYVSDYYGNDVTEASSTPEYEIYGALYNLQAAMNWEVCPTGWSLPTNSDWIELELFAGKPDSLIQAVSGEVLAWPTQSLLDDVYWSGTNALGFSLRPSGARASYDTSNISAQTFMASGSATFLWSSTLVAQGDSAYRRIWTSAGNQVAIRPQHQGYSVRCIKDTE